MPGPRRGAAALENSGMPRIAQERETDPSGGFLQRMCQTWAANPPRLPFGTSRSGKERRPNWCQKEILQTVFDHIPVMIAFMDQGGGMQLVNRHWEQVLGWSLEERDAGISSASVTPTRSITERYSITSCTERRDAGIQDSGPRRATRWIRPGPTSCCLTEPVLGSAWTSPNANRRPRHGDDRGPVASSVPSLGRSAGRGTAPPGSELTTKSARRSPA